MTWYALLLYTRNDYEHDKQRKKSAQSQNKRCKHAKITHAFASGVLRDGITNPPQLETPLH